VTDAPTAMMLGAVASLLVTAGLWSALRGTR
jgi:hypothetical protein